MHEIIVEIKTCSQCSCQFDITDKDLEFYEKISPVFEGKKYSIPSPVLCSDCRAQNILSLRNERNLYRRKCDFTEKPIISIHSPNNSFPVYDQNTWWSDDFDGIDYGVDYDYNKSFFEQFQKLYNTVPKISLNAPMSQNSEYSNQCQGNKDSYMLFCSGDNENCYYGMWNQNCIYCCDCLYTEFCENCYQVINAKNSYTCKFSQNIENCTEVLHCSDCINCKDCIGCINLENKEYYIFNKAYKKEDYFKKKKELELHDLEKLSQNFQKDFPRKYYHGKKNELFSGDYLESSEKTYFSYNCRDNRETKYCRDTWKSTMCHDLIENLAMEYCYQVEGTSFSNSCLYSMKLHDTNNVVYSSHCNFGNHLFGCVGLKNKSYCILNKQYSKEEYNKLIPKIIEKMRLDGKWGEFFPVSMSPFGYNETVAQEYFPLTKEDALEKGYKWSEHESPTPDVEKIIPADKLPDDISEIPDDILNWAIKCEESGKLFKIIPQELEFYRKHNLPIPRKHHDIRHAERMAKRNPRKLYDRNCDKCGVELQSTYDSKSDKKVYCEGCYNKEII